jgi:hypothetical protein
MSCVLVSAWRALFKVAPSIDKRAERRGIRVVIQTLTVNNGDQKEIERQGIGITALNIVIPYQPLVDPAELLRHSTDPRGA